LAQCAQAFEMQPENMTGSGAPKPDRLAQA
jgi:hypothetical protein